MISASAGSEATIQLADKWLKYCVENHPRCPGRLHEEQSQLQRLGMTEESYKSQLTADFFRLASPDRPLFLPTRLIDVGPPDGDQRPRLCHSKDVVISDPRYLALSHCWGRNIELILKTTKATLHERLEGFNMSQLPPTFRDAVTDYEETWCTLSLDRFFVYRSRFRRRLEPGSIHDGGGVQLLILYFSRFFSSEDSGGGLLQPRNPLYSSPCVLTYPSESGISEGYVVHPATPLETMEEEMLKNEPLLKRANARFTQGLRSATVAATAATRPRRGEAAAAASRQRPGRVEGGALARRRDAVGHSGRPAPAGASPVTSTGPPRPGRTVRGIRRNRRSTRPPDPHVDQEEPAPELADHRHATTRPTTARAPPLRPLCSSPVPCGRGPPPARASSARPGSAFRQGQALQDPQRDQLRPCWTPPRRRPTPA